MSARRGGYRMRGKLPDAAAAISRYATNYVRKNLGLVFPVSSFIWTCNQLALLSLLERRKVSECSPPAGRPKLDNNRINLERHLSGLRPSSERTGAKLEMPAARYVTIPWQSRNRKQFWEINMFVSASAFLGFFFCFFSSCTKMSGIVDLTRRCRDFCRCLADCNYSRLRRRLGGSRIIEQVGPENRHC